MQPPLSGQKPPAKRCRELSYGAGSAGPVPPLGLRRDDPEPGTDGGTVPLRPLPARQGAAYLASRFASGTRQTGGTHWAGGASVARRAGCSLFPRFALIKGGGEKSRETTRVSRRASSAAFHPAIAPF